MRTRGCRPTDSEEAHRGSMSARGRAAPVTATPARRRRRGTAQLALHRAGGVDHPPLSESAGACARGLAGAVHRQHRRAIPAAFAPAGRGAFGRRPPAVRSSPARPPRRIIGGRGLADAAFGTGHQPGLRMRADSVVGCRYAHAAGSEARRPRSGGQRPASAGGIRRRSRHRRPPADGGPLPWRPAVAARSARPTAPTSRAAPLTLWAWRVSLAGRRRRAGPRAGPGLRACCLEIPRATSARLRRVAGEVAEHRRVEDRRMRQLRQLGGGRARVVAGLDRRTVGISRGAAPTVCGSSAAANAHGLQADRLGHVVVHARGEAAFGLALQIADAVRATIGVRADPRAFFLAGSRGPAGNRPCAVHVRRRSTPMRSGRRCSSAPVPSIPSSAASDA